MAKVSLMMPVYKTERFIEKSLRSALEQTLDDYEIVIVDDASPDGSMAVAGRVLAEYPHMAERVKIVTHPANKGIAAARQTALDNAEGEYTFYLDSDDWAEPEMLERMYVRARETDADIVVCDYYVEFPARRKYVSQAGVPSTGKELARMLLREELSWAVWNKLIRRSLYLDNGVGWVAGVNLGEDMLSIIKLSLHADRVSYLPEAFLHYRNDNPSSLTTVITRKSIDDLIEATNLLERFIVARPDGADYGDDMIRLKLRQRSTLIINTRGAEQKKMARLWPEIPLRYTLIYPAGGNIIYRVAHFCASAGLYRTTAAMLNIIRHVKNNL
jgi:glycosyltransferase involved in cell wall biosynthesis